MDDFAVRARALVGCRFRPQGRDSATGLDCIGLVLDVFRIPPEQVCRNYRLRGNDVQRLRDGLDLFFRTIPAGEAQTGDVLLFQVAPDQLHLGIRTDAGLVHAHAGIGRVVETPGAAPWPILATYRRRAGRRRKG